VERKVAETRLRAARLLGDGDPRRVVIDFNGNDALNLAIHGTLQPGDHVVTTAIEHNSVLRPLRSLEEHAGVAVTRVGCDSHGFIDPDDIAAYAVVTKSSRSGRSPPGRRPIPG
jgi:cysteine desulfurase / selenocysteine lyase